MPRNRRAPPRYSRDGPAAPPACRALQKPKRQAGRGRRLGLAGLRFITPATNYRHRIDRAAALSELTADGLERSWGKAKKVTAGTLKPRPNAAKRILVLGVNKENQPDFAVATLRATLGPHLSEVLVMTDSKPVWPLLIMIRPKIWSMASV